MLSRLVHWLSRRYDDSDLLLSELYDEQTFYPAFMRDLKDCNSEAIIESPFVSSRRLAQILPALEKVKQRKVRVIFNTRDPYELDEGYRRDEAQKAIASLQRIGVHVLFTGGHHRKLVIIDRAVLYEGSLNVLSQNNSSEVMRRIHSTKLAWAMVRFIDMAYRHQNVGSATQRQTRETNQLRRTY